ncbi:MAG: hypothetical protein WBD74_09390 [Candidatus Aquilonibacter sp.]
MSTAGRRYIRLGSLALMLCAGLLAACSGSTTNVFQLPSASASPTTSSSATVPPPGVLSVNPSAVSISGTGASAAQNVDVQEIGYTGAFGESDNCTGVATIAPSSGSGPSASFTVTPSAAGTCSATFTDSKSQHVAVAITVTTTGFTVNTR